MPLNAPLNLTIHFCNVAITNYRVAKDKMIRNETAYECSEYSRVLWENNLISAKVTRYEVFRHFWIIPLRSLRKIIVYEGNSRRIFSFEAILLSVEDFFSLLYLSFCIIKILCNFSPSSLSFKIFKGTINDDASIYK